MTYLKSISQFFNPFPQSVVTMVPVEPRILHLINTESHVTIIQIKVNKN